MGNKSGGSDSADPGKELQELQQERQDWSRLPPGTYNHRVETTSVTIESSPAPPSRRRAKGGRWRSPSKRDVTNAGGLLTTFAATGALVLEEYQRQFPFLREYPTTTGAVLVVLLGVMVLFGRRLFRP